MVKYIEDQNLYFFKFTGSCALWYMSSYVYVSFIPNQGSFETLRPMLEHSVTYNSIISQDLLKRI